MMNLEKLRPIQVEVIMKLEAKQVDGKKVLNSRNFSFFQDLYYFFFFLQISKSHSRRFNLRIINLEVSSYYV